MRIPFGEVGVRIPFGEVGGEVAEFPLGRLAEFPLGSLAYVLEQGGGIYLYVDGQLDASSSMATNNCGVGCSGFNAADRLAIGDGGNCRFNAGAFVGEIDDVSMWQGALIATEVQELYENQRPD